MKVVCSRCKSDNVTVQSRHKYFVRSAISLVVLLPCILELNVLKDDEVDVITIISIITCLILFCLSVIFGVIYLRKGLAIGETTYKCEFCLNKSSELFTVQKRSLDELMPLSLVRRRK